MTGIKAVASTMVLAALLGRGGASHAASSTCTVGIAPAECTTDWVRANPTTHHIHIKVSPWQTYYLKDIDTHVVVAHGTNGMLGTERTVTGLYGRYTGTVNNALTALLIGGGITISNN